MSKRSQFSITIIILAILGSLTALISASFIKDKITESLIDEEAKSELVLTEQIANILETEVKSIHDKLNLIASFPQIQSKDAKECNKKLVQVQENIKSQLDNITRFHTNLVLDCAINQKAIGYTLTPESEITAVIKDPDHKPYLSYSGFSPVSNQEVLYLNVPVYNSGGDYSGIIGGVIYLNYIGDKYLKDLTVGEGGYVVLFDDNANLLYYPDKKYLGKNFNSPEFQALIGNDPALNELNKKILADSKMGKSGIARYSLLGQEKIVVYASAKVFPNRTWTVVSTIPIESIISNIEKNEKFGGVNLFLTLYSAILLIFILFSALVLFFITRGLFSPLNRIKNITEKIGQGNFQIEIDPKLLSPKDELGQLARSIQQMRTHLHESYENLQGKVKEKTIQLNQKIEELEKSGQAQEDAQTALVHVMKDVQAEKIRLIESRAKDDAMLESIGDGLVVTNQTGQIIRANTQAEIMLGLKNGEAVDKNLIEIMPLEDNTGRLLALEERPIHLAISSGKKVEHAQYFLVKKDGTKLPVSMTVTPFYILGKIAGAIDIFHNITQELAITNAKAKQLDEETKLEHQEKDFISMASHQLLTPLTLVKGYISMILSGKLGKIDQDARGFLEESLHGSDRMSNLVKSLLTTSRLESGNIKILKTDFDLDDVMQTIVLELKLKLAEKKLAIELPTPKKIIVHADIEHTREVLINILDNAIKYSDQGQIVVTESQKDGQAIVSVKDHGVGINQKDLPHIFEKFYSSENWLKTQSESHGLGLYVAELLLKLMGGSISVESKIGEGSTFFVNLPLSKNV